ncbi:hypothetical protein AMS68_002153 [Peltaster fructicola]|uniref:Carboxymuconolactone decarboxylase-like domain-containing protein n=1 Tax=Peltaster fructicola TaxID=286661 RepID=A0A6H0XPM4_9PEZI|nr:hypothetical protein AMS68_002153 [Peltaster fructicola]
MRIPYASDAASNAEDETIYQRIKDRRAPRPLIPLDLALLHNSAIADGYNSLLGAIRTKTSLSPALMELAISYVGVLTNATYEWTAHSALAVKAGVTLEKLEKLLQRERTWSGFSDEERAVLEFTEQSTLQVRVNDAVFERVKTLLGSDQKIMELSITIGAYNMHLRGETIFASSTLRIQNDRLHASNKESTPSSLLECNTATMRDKIASLTTRKRLAQCADVHLQ